MSDYTVLAVFSQVNDNGTVTYTYVFFSCVNHKHSRSPFGEIT